MYLGAKKTNRFGRVFIKNLKWKANTIIVVLLSNTWTPPPPIHFSSLFYSSEKKFVDCCHCHCRYCRRRLERATTKIYHCCLCAFQQQRQEERNVCAYTHKHTPLKTIKVWCTLRTKLNKINKLMKEKRFMGLFMKKLAFTMNCIKWQKTKVKLRHNNTHSHTHISEGIQKKSGAP